MHAPRAAVPLCTLASIPRQPEHCVEWAQIIAWEAERGHLPLDSDDPEHISWLYSRALARARDFNISGVTYSLTQGVVKHIIPAIASTNAVVAASCTSEALKLISGCNPFLANYMMYAGDAGVYTFTFAHDRKPDCPVCSGRARAMDVDADATLAEFIAMLGDRPEAQLKRPSVRAAGRSLYFQSPPGLEAQTRPNLARKLRDLVADGDEVGVTDPAFAINFRYVLKFR